MLYNSKKQEVLFCAALNANIPAPKMPIEILPFTTNKKERKILVIYPIVINVSHHARRLLSFDLNAILYSATDFRC